MKCRDHNNKMHQWQGYDNVQSSPPSFKALHFISCAIVHNKKNREWFMLCFLFSFDSRRHHNYNTKIGIVMVFRTIAKKKKTINYTTVANYHHKLTPNVVVVFHMACCCYVTKIKNLVNFLSGILTIINLQEIYAGVEFKHYNNGWALFIGGTLSLCDLT